MRRIHRSGILRMSNMQEEIKHIGLVALAGLLGAIVGVEREFADKPAGLRTHIFVAAASALLMLLGDGILERFREQGHDALDADPIRVVQAIVVGISFLGAGTIIHHSNRRVEGLTTAASILLTSGVGIAVALEKFYLAVGVAVLALLILLLVGWIERKINPTRGAPGEDAPSENGGKRPLK